MSEYTCDTGNEDDGISDDGDDCPADDCDGSVRAIDPKTAESSYLNLIEAARHRFEALLSSRETEDDAYHVALDALALLRERIDADDTYRPWEDYYSCMNFYLSVEMDNAAFEDESDELARIVRGVARDISDGNNVGYVRDTYGNTVGNWRIS